jgi:hypothetical protein
MPNVRRLSVLLLATLAVPAAGADKLELKHVPNSKSVYQTETKTEQTLTIGETDVETKATSFIVSGYTVGAREPDGSLSIQEKHQVLQTNLELPGGIQFQFDSGNPDAKPAIPQLEPLAAVLRTSFNTPVTTVLDANGKVREVNIPAEARNDLDPMFAALFEPDKLKKSAEQARSLLPSEPVSPGDTWERNVDMNLDSSQTLSFVIRFEYAGTVAKDGKRLHRIVPKPTAVTYTMAADSPSPLKVIQSDLKVTESEGELLFDAEQGQIVKETGRTRIQGPMTFTLGGQELPGKVNLQITKTSTRQP